MLDSAKAEISPPKSDFRRVQYLAEVLWMALKPSLCAIGEQSAATIRSAFHIEGLIPQFVWRWIEIRENPLSASGILTVRLLNRR